MEQRMPLKAIIWDLDGTLIHFKIDYLRARRTAINILKNYGVPKRLLTVKVSILENMELAREYFENYGLSKEKIDTIIEEVDTEIRKIEYEAALKATIINGIDQVLEYAKNKNLKQAIFTFNTRKNAEISLKTVKLNHYFKIILGRDNVMNPKPHPDHLTQICKQLNVKPNEILVIGDNIRDIEAAINVGAYSIAVLSNSAYFEILQKANKIIKINEIPQELIKEIEKLL
jgi:phosphoglycolate phosphatase